MYSLVQYFERHGYGIPAPERYALRRLGVVDNERALHALAHAPPCCTFDHTCPTFARRTSSDCRPCPGRVPARLLVAVLAVHCRADGRRESQGEVWWRYRCVSAGSRADERTAVFVVGHVGHHLVKTLLKNF